MFVTQNYAYGDRLYTTIPQLAAASVFGTYLKAPNCGAVGGLNIDVCNSGGDALQSDQPYSEPVEASASPMVTTPDQWPNANGENPGDNVYRYPGVAVTSFDSRAHAPFYVFTLPGNPYGGASLVPLIRLAIAEACRVRGSVHASSEASASAWEGADACPSVAGTQSYHRDGIEGYLLPSCPSQFGNCTNFSDTTAPQAVYLRVNAATGGYALVLESHLNDTVYSGFADANNGIPLGYAFPNVDSDQDGIIDGFERLIGTNPNRIDSDCNGLVGDAGVLVGNDSDVRHADLRAGVRRPDDDGVCARIDGQRHASRDRADGDVRTCDEQVRQALDLGERSRQPAPDPGQRDGNVAAEVVVSAIGALVVTNRCEST